MIMFTRYLRPDGRKRDAGIERPAEIEALAATVVQLGGRFEIETLRTGVVSLEVLVPDPEEDLRSVAHELCDNGPEVPAAVDKLVRTAYRALTGGLPT
jgi:hypothetical protein